MINRNFFYLLFLLLGSTLVSAEEPIVLKIQTNKPTSSVFYLFEEQLLREIERDSHGILRFELKGINGFVNNRSAYNALRTGELDALLMTPAYWANADPVFAIMGDLVAAWNSPQQYSHWLKTANGIHHLEEAYARVGLKLLGYYIAAPESLISHKPLPNINALNGLTMRAPPGMISDFFTLLGAKVKNISGGRVLGSLEQKRIDAADNSDLHVNNQLGAYKIVKHSNYPGFHSMPLYDFVIRQHSWNKLTPKQQEVILRAIKRWQVQVAKISQTLLVSAEQDVLSQGVTLHTWSAQELKKARKHASIVWEKYAARNDRAKALVQELKQWLINEGNLDK